MVGLAACRSNALSPQSQNALLFQRLHWTTIAEVEFHCRPHHFMQADLDHYPPFADAETGFLSLPKKAA